MKLFGHLTVFGIILAIALYCVVNNIAMIWGVNGESLSQEPVVVEFSFDKGQEDFLKKISYFVVYYATAKDKELSDRQTSDLAYDKKDLYAKQRMVLAPAVTNFRLDFYCKGGRWPEEVNPPRLASFAVNGREVPVRRLVPRCFKEVYIPFYQYDTTPRLNGWKSRLIPAAILVWILCMAGLYPILRKITRN